MVLISNDWTTSILTFRFLFQEDRLKAREVRRSRFGTEIDFADYKPSFQKHISQKADALAKQDDD